MITHPQHGGEISKSTTQGNNLRSKSATEKDVVEGESSARRPILLKSERALLLERVNQAHLMITERVERRWNVEVFVVEIANHDQRCLLGGNERFEVRAKCHQILGGMTDELLVLILSVAQVQANNGCDYSIAVTKSCRGRPNDYRNVKRINAVSAVIIPTPSAITFPRRAEICGGVGIGGMVGTAGGVGVGGMARPGGGAFGRRGASWLPELMRASRSRPGNFGKCHR